jgi:glycerol-3-phosphate cytidylyltransferase
LQKKKTIITYGTYDMFHIGHLSILERAKSLGDYLIVGVTDRTMIVHVVNSMSHKRVKAIEALGFVDKVILETHKEQKAEDMQKYNVDIFAIGDDWVELCTALVETMEGEWKIIDWLNERDNL